MIHRFSFLLIFILAFSAKAFSREIEDRLSVYNQKWFLIETPHIKIMTNGDVDRFVKVANDLEIFRNFSLSLLGVREKNEEPPLLIWPTKQSDFYKLSDYPTRNLLGYFSPSYEYQFAVILPPIKPFFGISDETRETELIIAKHEYTHYLTLANSSFVYPDWYAEGLADYLSTLYIADNNIYVGLPLFGRVKEYPYANKSVKDLVFSSNIEATMYGKSWALTHYLFSRPDYLKKINSVLIEGNLHGNYGEIMEKQFNLTNLDNELDAYVMGESYKNAAVYGIKDTYLPSKPTVKTLEKNESDMILTSFFTRNLNKSDPESIVLANAIAGLLGDSLQGLLLKSELAFLNKDYEALQKYLGMIEEKDKNSREAKIVYSLVDVYKIIEIRKSNKNNVSSYAEDCKSNMREILAKNIRDVYAIRRMGTCYLLQDPGSDMGIKLLETALYYRPEMASVRIELLDRYLAKNRYADARVTALKMRMAHGAFSGMDDVIKKIDGAIAMQKNSQTRN